MEDSPLAWRTTRTVAVASTNQGGLNVMDPPIAKNLQKISDFAQRSAPRHQPNRAHFHLPDRPPDVKFELTPRPGLLPNPRTPRPQLRILILTPLREPSPPSATPKRALTVLISRVADALQICSHSDDPPSIERRANKLLVGFRASRVI